MHCTLYPLDRVEIDDKVIFLGMPQDSVFKLLGKGESFDKKRYYYFDSELAIDFNKEKRVAFIEFLGGIDGALQPVIYGVSAFEANADDLAEILKQNNNGAIDDAEGENALAFLEISVGVYRECTPADVNEMIEEAKNDGNPMDEEEIEEEMRRANHWATIGCGISCYYD